MTVRPTPPTFASRCRLVAVALGLLLAGGCGSSDAFGVVPSLPPVDAARAYVRFSLIQGEACGRAAVRDALRDMDRLEVDGYLDIVIEVTGRGDDRCARASGYPFRYGTDTTTPALRTGDSTDPVLVPGRGGAASGPGVDSESACRRAIPMTGITGDTALEFAIDDCVQRCRTDAAFAQCIAEAAEPTAVAACLAIEEDTP